MNRATCRVLSTLFGLLAAALAQGEAPHAHVTPIVASALAEYPGKAVEIIEVDYPPGAVDPVHRHDAHAFVYVLEGSIVMGVRGGQQVTLTRGQTFHEQPDDVHTVGRNASATQPAKFLVFLLKDRDAPILTPVDEAHP